MKKTILTILALAAVVMSYGSQKAEASVTATLTADNHYGLYYGALDGTGLTFIGRNEVGTPGSTPGTLNWEEPESYIFDAPGGNYLYLLAWDDEQQQMIIGDFILPDASVIHTNSVDWLYYVSTNPNPGPSGAVPSLGTVAADISGATWSIPGADANALSTWGSISGIDPSANFIWHDTFDINSSSDGNYVIFRSANPIPDVPAASPVPEPASMILFGVGSGLLGFIRNKKK